MRLALIPLAALLLATGCNWFDDPSPNRARVVITGDAAKPVRMIVSTEFLASVNDQGQTRVVILKSDTVNAALPYEKEYNIEDGQRFFIETARSVDDLQTMHMQVFVDSRRQFDETGALITGAPFRFLYMFNTLVTQDISVVL